MCAALNKMKPCSLPEKLFFMLTFAVFFGFANIVWSFTNQLSLVHRIPLFLNHTFMKNAVGDEIADVYLEDIAVTQEDAFKNDYNDSTSAVGFGSIITIAIGTGITSKRQRPIDESNIAEKFQFFRVFLRSFCATSSSQYVYNFYLAYDYNDPVFSKGSLLTAFKQAFADQTVALCGNRSIAVSLHLVRCSYSGRPAWAQNDAMMEAYLDNNDYFYRINDDTKMLTGGWAEQFIATLHDFEPPNVGVVGPHHYGGNQGILTYDFVHRTHVDIFGFYYPRLFTDWWGDDWMTRVYEPGRSKKLHSVRIVHTLSLGQRYSVRRNRRNDLKTQLIHDAALVNRYAAAVRQWKYLTNGRRSSSTHRKVISMSLYGNNSRYMWGAVRNAQLVHILLPEWTLRVYIADHNSSLSTLLVPARVVDKLRQLGVQIARVSADKSILNPKDWRLLAASDFSVDYVLIRDSDWRLTDREASVLREWVDKAERDGPATAIIHCIKDHPKHTRHIVDGLWGVRPRAFYDRLGKTVLVSLTGTLNASLNSDLLNDVVWPAVRDSALCHDSASPCRHRHLPFTVDREAEHYVGEKYNEHELSEKSATPMEKDNNNTKIGHISLSRNRCDD